MRLFRPPRPLYPHAPPGPCMPSWLLASVYPPPWTYIHAISSSLPMASTVPCPVAVIPPHRSNSFLPRSFNGFLPRSFSSCLPRVWMGGTSRCRICMWRSNHYLRHMAAKPLHMRLAG
jgi:hypothetical protein